jgi:hypothetical protein
MTPNPLFLAPLFALGAVIVLLAFRANRVIDWENRCLTRFLAAVNKRRERLQIEPKAGE